MGLDNIVEDRDQQIVDQDVDTGEWGLAGQIAESARGRIPEDQQRLVLRYEDALVRQALERDMNRDAIADLLGFTRRTTFYKEKRAYAYDFPLEAFQSGRRGWTGSEDSGEDGHDVEMAEERDDQREGKTAADGQDDDADPSVDGENLGEVQVWSTPEPGDSATVAELLDDAEDAADDVVADDGDTVCRNAARTRDFGAAGGEVRALRGGCRSGSDTQS